MLLSWFLNFRYGFCVFLDELSVRKDHFVLATAGLPVDK